MASWDEVRRIALALPEAEEGTAYGKAAWRLRGKLFVWERPLRRKEIEAPGPRPPHRIELPSSYGLQGAPG